MSYPIADGRTTVNKTNAFNQDIIQVLESNFAKAKENTKNFAQQFEAGTDEATARNVWNFLKKHIRYKRDPEHLQLIRIPGRFINDGEGDCKSYALSACSILANLGFKTAFRYTSYNSSNTPTHVYCIAQRNGKKFIVDGVYNTFNKEKPYSFKIDHTMNIETLSGIEKASKYFDLNNKEHLRAAYNNFQNKNSLAAKIFQKRISGNLSTLNYTPDQLNAYANRLNNAIATNKHRFVKAVLLDELNQVRSGRVNGGIFGTGEDHNIGKLNLKKAFKKVGKGLKKVGAKLKQVGLAPNRNAFLLLVRLNVKNIARKLKEGNQAAIKAKWEKLGGSYSKLKDAFEHGAHKKMIGEIGGEPVTISITGALALAAPIIAALAVLFRKKPKPGEPGYSESGNSTVDTLLNTFDQLKGAAIDAGVSPNFLHEADRTGADIADDNVEVTDSESGFSTPLIIGAVAVGAFLLMKK